MKKLSLAIMAIMAFTFISNPNFAQMNTPFSGKTITIKSPDGVIITADLYILPQAEAPLIILYHQAGFSRGEYRPIAPQLNQLGFSCISIDQRSGDEVNGIINQTHAEAEKLHLATKYVDAIPDVEAAFHYAKNELKAENIIIWGSSYSASLSFYMSSKYPDDIKGIIAFSPGEYFTIDGQEISSFAAQVKCSVFISSAKSEEKKWRGIYEVIPSEKSYYLPTDEGFHGSRALWSINEGHEACWKEIEAFLKRFKN